MEKIKIKVLLLPKFDGEARPFYEYYCQNGDSYGIFGGFPGEKLHVREGVALYVTGMGKVNAVLSLMAVLGDPRFDFSDCRFISVGCAGGASGYATMGDVFVITAAVDYDLGHHADPRALKDPNRPTWFHDPVFDSSAFRHLDTALTDRVYRFVKDTPLETTENTLRFLESSCPEDPRAGRAPRVLRGTTVSGDNYWKGALGHRNARAMAAVYGCPDPYALSEMEDAALAVALDRLGLLNRLLILRACVNLDCFMAGATPESLWDAGHDLVSAHSAEAADIFPVAMENLFRVVQGVIAAILAEEL